MNAKKCKALRSVAREITTKLPERRLVDVQIRLHGKVIGIVKKNDPKTFRGAYRRMKKAERRAA